MKLRPFELALIIIFIVIFAIGLLLMMTYQGGGASTPAGSEGLSGSVQIWGTLPAPGVDRLIASYASQFDLYQNVQYFYVPIERFESTLINALADGGGPDLVLISHEQIVELRRRLVPTSYEQLPARTFQDRYVDGAQIFARPDGIYALPVAMDPLMLYWNREQLTNQNFLTPPATWEALQSEYFDDLISRDFNRSINEAVVAMGEVRNVRNAVGIMSALLLQSGTAGVREQNGAYRITLNTGLDGRGFPVRSALDFYTRFSNPASRYYSWNRSLPLDRSEFVAEDLAFYFGFVSEAREITQLNPNLVFDVAEIPQAGSNATRRTYARFYGLGMLRTTDNPAFAAAVMNEFTGQAASDLIAGEVGHIPVYRASIAAGSDGMYTRVAYQSAPIARAWLSPGVTATRSILDDVVVAINENTSTLDEGVDDFIQLLRREYE
jgi:ABC-type glycerol-3-phosphate transport system substrate-binding protein